MKTEKKSNWIEQIFEMLFCCCFLFVTIFLESKITIPRAPTKGTTSWVFNGYNKLVVYMRII